MPVNKHRHLPGFLGALALLASMPSFAANFQFRVFAPGVAPSVAAAPTVAPTCTTPWAAVLAQSEAVLAYSTSSVPYGSSCSSEVRTCNQGVLSGTFGYSACAASSPSNCTLPWGGTVASGAPATVAYSTSTVPYGQTCSSELRSCTNGVLSGSYANASCTPQAPASCTLPWGGTLASGSTLPAYSGSVANSSLCPSTEVMLSCTNGILSVPTATQICVVADPNFSSVASLLHLDGVNGSTTVIDQKGSAYAFVNGGNISTSAYKIGSAAAYLPGTNNNAIVGPNLSLTGDFTIELWANPAGVSGVHPLISQWSQTTGQAGYLLAISAGKPSFYFGAYSENGALMASSTSVAANSWMHLAVTRQGSTFRMFVNGALTNTATFASAGRTLAVPITMGQYYNSAGTLGAATVTTYGGYLDEMRVTVGTARYTAAFTPQTTPFPDQ